MSLYLQLFLTQILSTVLGCCEKARDRQGETEKAKLKLYLIFNFRQLFFWQKDGLQVQLRVLIQRGLSSYKPQHPYEAWGHYAFTGLQVLPVAPAKQTAFREYAVSSRRESG